ncbi:MAG: hypothetical protein AUH85_07050 [Chloroflexi bacterium 13_1_40CM_4_68_4]|nr:MAG: hypothetical protein AUH85_07050 [Chloroflexi bacterium 13_1_40CM_4_68_4]
MSDDIRITPRAAHESVSRGEALLLDVIGDAAWRSLREVPAGAIRLPPEEAVERLDRLPRDKSFAVFCT